MRAITAFLRPSFFRSGPRWLAACVALAAIVGASTAANADPAVKFMEKVGRDLMAAARTQSPVLMQNAFKRYADVGYIGNYSLGTYRAKLIPSDRQIYLTGMAKFIGRYAVSQIPKYPVVKYQIMSPSLQGGSGLMVDSRIWLRDGSTYDVRWLLAKYGNSYRVRDAMVYGFWMTPFLKSLFETYIGENGGNVKSLVVALNR